MLRRGLLISVAALIVVGCGNDGTSGAMTQSAPNAPGLASARDCLDRIGARLFAKEREARAQIGASRSASADRQATFWGKEFQVEEFWLGAQEGDEPPPSALVAAPVGANAEWSTAFESADVTVFAVADTEYLAALACFGVDMNE